MLEWSKFYYISFRFINRGFLPHKVYLMIGFNMTSVNCASIEQGQVSDNIDIAFNCAYTNKAPFYITPKIDRFNQL